MPRSVGLTAILDQAVARIRFGHAVRSAAAGGFGAAVALIAARALHLGSTSAAALAGVAFLVTAAGTFAARRRQRTPAMPALALERGAPSLRHRAITAPDLP